MTPTTCTHKHIKTWVFEDTHEPAMWSCVDCGLKFAPEMATLEAGRAQGLREAAELMRELGCLLKGNATPTTEEAALAIESLLQSAAAIKQLEGKK